MNWVTFIWAQVIAACVIMAMPHLLVGLRRKAWENLFFVLAAFSVAAIAFGELAIMHSRTIDDIARAQRWTYLPVFFLVVGIVGFVHFYFGTGRIWIGIAACLTRFVALAINFAYPPCLNFREITGVRVFDFLGDKVAMPEGVISGWTRIGELSSLLLLAFVIDASLTLARRGSAEDRMRATVLGGSIGIFIVVAAGLTSLIYLGAIHTPFLISFPFLGVIAAMGFELSRDILRAAQTARELRASESALRESQQRLNLAASAANLGLWVWDIERDEIWITAEGRVLVGLNESEPLNLNRFLKAIHPEDRERVEGLIRASLADGGEYERDYRIVLPSGLTRWIAGYGRLELDKQGSPACMRGVIRDVTQRKLAEENIRTSEELNRTVLASLHNQIAILDRAGTIVAVNDAWKQFALTNGGAVSSVGVGVNYLEVCRGAAAAGDEVAGRILEGIRGVISGTSEFFEIEYPCHSPSEPRWFLARVVPLKTLEGGAVVSHAEVTRLKQVGEALRESEARFRTVADAAPVMIWMAGGDKLCTFFNKGWLEFTGRTPDQELGNGWITGVHGDDAAHCHELYETAFDRRESFTMEYRLRRKDGDYRWVLDTGTPRFDADGTFLGYIGSCIDIAERKQAELDHQLQSMELARVGRLVLMGELAASLAHEVNNPIGAMVTNASAGQRLIASGNVDMTQVNDVLSDIVADGHRAREVIDGIRNMVRKSETSRSVVQIDDTIQDLLRIVRADAMARNVVITVNAASNGYTVMANRVHLLQVLLNLTMNGFEALSVLQPNARRLMISTGRNGGGEIFISVRDNGPGFPAGLVEQVFEPFFSTKAEGTGMGLAIARSIIEAHGGTLSGENCEDGGARFIVRLPEIRQEALRKRPDVRRPADQNGASG